MLEIQYRKKFKNSVPALLLAGSQLDITELLAFFRTWDGRRVDLAAGMKQGQVKYVAGVNGLVLQLKDEGDWSNLHVDGEKGLWEISKLGQRQIIGLLESLKDSKDPGHQYLEHGNKTIQIICSKDEYPAQSKHCV